MFNDLNENCVIVTDNLNEKVEFSKTDFDIFAEDYSNFIDEVIHTYDLDPKDLGSAWSCNEPIPSSYVKRRYMISTYANLEVARQLIPDKPNPRILEIGSHITGLLPAMYLSSKGFKPEVLDKEPIQEKSPQLSDIATRDYGVKIHHNRWEESVEILNNQFDMIYLQSFPPFNNEKEEIRFGKKIANMLKEEGICIVNDGGTFDFLSMLKPYFREEMDHLKWRWIGEMLDIDQFDIFINASRIAVLRKNSELEKLAFYIEDKDDPNIWPIIYNNFVTEEIAEKYDIDEEKFTCGLLFSLILNSDQDILELPLKSDFDLNLANDALRSIKNRLYWEWIYSRYSPTQINWKIGQFASNLGDDPLSSKEEFLSLRNKWIQKVRTPAIEIVSTNKESRNALDYFYGVYDLVKNDWNDFLQRCRKSGEIV